MNARHLLPAAALAVSCFGLQSEARATVSTAPLGQIDIDTPVVTGVDLADYTTRNEVETLGTAALEAATNYTDAALSTARAEIDAAVRSIPAPDLTALPAAEDITLGGTNLIGLLPEYIETVETARTTRYTGFSRDTALRNGKLILALFRTQPTGDFTLNLTLADGTTTGALPVRFWGTSAVSTQLPAGSIVPMVYREGVWYWSDRDTNNDTYNRLRITGSIRAGGTAITRNALCGGTTNGYAKLAPGVKIRTDMPLLYLNRTTTLGARASETQFYVSFPIVDLTYTQPGFIPRIAEELYLLGSLSDDGLTFTVGDPMFSYEPIRPCYPLGFSNHLNSEEFMFYPGPLMLPPSVPATRTIAGVPLTSDIPQTGRLSVTNGALRVFVRTNDLDAASEVLAWDSAAAAAPATVERDLTALGARVSALESGGGASKWASFAATGAENPDPDVTMLNRAYTAIGSGFFWASSGGHYCLCASGSVAFLAESGGALRIFGNSADSYFGIRSGGTVTVGANATGFEVVGEGASAVARISYPYSGGAHPVVFGAASLEGPWTEMTAAVWTDDADAGTTTATFPATADAFFYKATTTAEQGEMFISTLPAYLPGGVAIGENDLDPVVYDSKVKITVGGRTYRIAAEAVQ